MITKIKKIKSDDNKEQIYNKRERISKTQISLKRVILNSEISCNSNHNHEISFKNKSNNLKNSKFASEETCSNENIKDLKKSGVIKFENDTIYVISGNKTDYCKTCRLLLSRTDMQQHNCLEYLSQQLLKKDLEIIKLKDEIERLKVNKTVTNVPKNDHLFCNLFNIKPQLEEYIPVLHNRKCSSDLVLNEEINITQGRNLNRVLG